jgi:glycopeptide antibiotics resistance protein
MRGKEVFLVGAVVTALSLLSLAGVLWYQRRKRRSSIGHLIAISLFAVYLFVAATYVFLPLRFDSGYMEMMRTTHVWANVNLIPFRFGSDYSSDPIGRQAMGNLLLGVPFGFGLPFVARVRGRSALVAAVLFGVGIETVQLILNLFHIAFPARTVDVNDVILNGTGVAVGFGLFLACRALYSRAREPSHPPASVWRHFHTVLTEGRGPR